MKRLGLLSAATAAAACAIPASAMASRSSGVVLTVSSRQHAVQVVDRSHVVHSYRYHGRASTVRPGSRIRFTHSGAVIGQLQAGRHAARRVTFLASVTRATSRVVSLRLGDGRRLTFRFRQVHSARTLAAGMTVLVTAVLRAGHVRTVEISPTHSAGGGAGGAGGSQGGAGSGQGSGSGTFDHSPPVSGSQDVTGTITMVSDSEVAITTLPDGRSMRFTANPDDGVTDGYLVGDQVTVSYQQLTDGALRANDVEYLDEHVSGTVVSATTGSVTIVVDGTGAVETLVDDPSDGMFDGVLPGDHVDIGYHIATQGLVVDELDDFSPV